MMIPLTFVRNLTKEEMKAMVRQISPLDTEEGIKRTVKVIEKRSWCNEIKRQK